jgi:hypothetical protein
MGVVKRIAVIRVACVFAVWIYASGSCPAQTPQNAQSLEARIDRGEVRAFREAGDLGRKDLIPAIERHAGDQPWARAALAKLGVRKYLDEILLEATGPTNQLVHQENEKHPAPAASEHDRLGDQMFAFDKLAHIKDRSTVKVLASFLYGKENTKWHNEGGDVLLPSASSIAMATLAAIVDNPPKVDALPTPEIEAAEIKTWQQWWEQNKDKYP